MTNDETRIRMEKPPPPKRLLLPTLAMSYFATQPVLIIGVMLLIDMGHTFNLAVGVTGQLRTLAFLVTTVSAVLMGMGSVKLRHKSLLLVGLGVFCVSAIGSALAVNFPMLLITYALSGLGMAMVTPMTFTLVAEHFSLDQRGKAIGWVNASMTAAGIVGAPIVGVIAGMGGWRWPFLGFMLPTALLSFLLARNEIPSAGQKIPIPEGNQKYFEGFKGILSNRSAIACLIGTVFFMIGWQAILVYGISFFRERFHVSLGFASVIVSITASSALLGTLVSGQLVNRVGRKPLSVLTALGAGIFIIIYANMANLWWAITCMGIECVWTGMWFTAGSNLLLEQVPRFRGSMMSIQRAAMSLGSAVGAGVGGVTLLLADYSTLGLVLGILGLVAAFIFYFWTVDPTYEPSE